MNVSEGGNGRPLEALLAEDSPSDLLVAVESLVELKARGPASVAENDRPIEVLLVEDNPGDVRLIREGLRDCRVANRVTVVEDGAEALAYLRRESKYAQASRPDFVLLDLNLPKKDGREVLAEIKADPELKRIPVLVLTTSQAQSDIRRAYDVHANCYIAKPGNLDDFIKVVKCIEEFWLNIAKLPKE